MCVYGDGALRVYVCETDLVRPVEVRLLNLEIEKSRQGDGIEEPGRETDNSNEEENQTDTNRFYILYASDKDKI